MKKFAVFVPSLLFLLFCGGFFLLHLATPDKAVSQQENRNLAALPKFSLTSFFSGKLTAEYETYLADQFPFRNTFVSVKAKSELALGKTELNGIFVCEDGTLAPRFEKPDESRLRRNSAAVQAFAETLESAGIPLYFTVIPGITDIWADRLPQNAPNPDQKAIAETIQNLTPAARFADTRTALLARKDEALYCQTDHHWTTLGAYYGYAALAEAMGIAPVPLGEPFSLLPDFYGTSSSASGIFPGQGDTLALYVPEGSMVLTADGEVLPLYDWSFAEQKDKYSVFLGGNTPLSVLKTGNPGPKLLLVKDSYANAEIPFLAAHFSEIHIADPRFYRQSLSAYAAENAMDVVVVSYYLVNFVTDNNIALIK